MATLLLRLAGPMQSWGVASRFDERDSGMEPSKSGVLGLVCAALGRDRSEPIADLAQLKLGVRVDREGALRRDFQTATGVLLATGKVALDRTVVSPRYYLADAAFLAGLEGDREILATIWAALMRPVWPLALGRKSMPPGLPVWMEGGLLDVPLREALAGWPRVARCRPSERGQALRMLIESDHEGMLRMDQPTAPFSSRQFAPRYVRTETIHVSDEVDA